MMLSATPRESAAQPDVVPTAQVAPASTRKLRVLLAEDTVANQTLVTAILQKRGHTVSVVHNGRDALAMLQREPFDLILMDVEMPVMDGIQATTAIRGLDQPNQSQIPIIAMTAHTMSDDHQRCLAAGMDAYLSKPVTSVKLLEMLDFAAHLGETRFKPRDC